MEENITAEKIIFSVLNVLLIAGAVLCVLTIDRGRWITSIPAFYESPGLPLESNVSASEAPAGIVTEGDEKLIPQTGIGCLTRSQLAGSQWYEAYLLLGNYQKAVIGIGSSGANPAGLTVCGK
jgi:hypothetical protein